MRLSTLVRQRNALYRRDAVTSKAGRQGWAHVDLKLVDVNDADRVSGAVAVQNYAPDHGAFAAGRLQPYGGVEVVLVMPGHDKLRADLVDAAVEHGLAGCGVGDAVGSPQSSLTCRVSLEGSADGCIVAEEELRLGWHVLGLHRLKLLFCPAARALRPCRARCAEGAAAVPPRPASVEGAPNGRQKWNVASGCVCRTDTLSSAAAERGNNSEDCRPANACRKTFCTVVSFGSSRRSTSQINGLLSVSIESGSTVTTPSAIVASLPARLLFGRAIVSRSAASCLKTECSCSSGVHDGSRLRPPIAAVPCNHHVADAIFDGVR